MAKIITFFNHKGGVGKTTLAYNVAWGLSQAGKRVLMIDGDPQCNLTEISMQGLDERGGQLNLFDDSSKADFDLKKNNAYEYFESYIYPDRGQNPEEPMLYEKKENLYLLPGSLRFAELEETISLAIAGIRGLNRVPQFIYEGLLKLGEDFDYIIIDLSPALSAMNQVVLMLSDYFLVPVNPSIFSRQALENLNQIFRTWNRNLSGFDIFSQRVKELPQMLGIVCQNYRPYSRKNEENTKSAQRFEVRLDELNYQATLLAKDLSGFGMALTEETFREIFESSDPYRIANIPDYNQLGVLSETEKIPVNGFDNKILKGAPGGSLDVEQYRKKVEDFKTECKKIVDGLLKL